MNYKTMNIMTIAQVQNYLVNEKKCYEYNEYSWYTMFLLELNNGYISPVFTISFNSTYNDNNASYTLTSYNMVLEFDNIDKLMIVLTYIANDGYIELEQSQANNIINELLDIDDIDEYQDNIDDYSQNMPCDNSGYCIGSTCKNYFIKCN